MALMLAAHRTRPVLALDHLGPVEVRETHISWVFLAGDRAFKVKKPIRLPYLDYVTPARRLAMCREEVELNRRLAPDVYVGVRGLVRGSDGCLALAEASDPEAVEYAVEMRRFDDDDTLDARLTDRRAGAAEIALLGRRLAAFHAESETCEATNGGERVKRALDDTFASLRAQVRPERRARVAAHDQMAGALVGARWDELDERARAGRIRDGHGDLRLEHVLLDEGGLAIVDCVEFDPALRRIDVAADLAFLVMDLHRVGRPDLSRTLVAAYREAGGDAASRKVLATLAAYRAQVRAKIALTRAAQRGDEESPEADALIALGGRLLWQALTPLVVVVAGLSASGKTTLATALAVESGFRHIATDVVRKRGVGLPPTARAPRSLYAPEANRATYEALGRAAQAAAPDGVIVDGTFRQERDRAAFFAQVTTTPLVIECVVPEATLLSRAAAREREAERVSDAGVSVVAGQLGRFEPLDELPAANHALLRTDRSLDAVVDEAGPLLTRRAIASRPR
jgi:aminoglycoside phosphotransferase family enzyme/predicted kinase